MQGAGRFFPQAYWDHTSRTKIGLERSSFGAWQGAAEFFMNNSG
jgi:hypothetical protein